MPSLLVELDDLLGLRSDVYTQSRVEYAVRGTLKRRAVIERKFFDVLVPVIPNFS